MNNVYLNKYGQRYNFYQENLDVKHVFLHVKVFDIHFRYFYKFFIGNIQVVL